MRLSFSAISTYNSCPKKFFYQYIERIRSIQKSSAFSIGTAIDSASECYLENLEAPERRELALKHFEEVMRQEHQDNDIKYSQADVQLELIEDIGPIMVKNGYDEDQDAVEFLAYCKNNMDKLDCEEYELLKDIQIEAVVGKGRLMLPLFFDWADENIQEVHSCQRKIQVENDLGDIFTGYLDFDVTLKNGKRYIIDMKTSSNPTKYYPDEAANESVQLAVYSEHTGIRNVGYFVIDKSIRKREPRVRFREVRGEISEEFLEEVFDNIEETRYNITQEKFDRNFDSCFEYGKCELMGLCKKGSMAGLCKKE